MIYLPVSGGHGKTYRQVTAGTEKSGQSLEQKGRGAGEILAPVVRGRLKVKKHRVHGAYSDVINIITYRA